jgi:hypothetical protein
MDTRAKLDWTQNLAGQPVPGMWGMATALDRLDASYTLWINGVRGLSADDLRRPCRAAEGPWGESPMADLILHINREALHHGAEIALLRDLYYWKES